jgi:hypothetical protein
VAFPPPHIALASALKVCKNHLFSERFVQDCTATSMDSSLIEYNPKPSVLRTIKFENIAVVSDEHDLK